jgi:hypothetical protein
MYKVGDVLEQLRCRGGENDVVDVQQEVREVGAVSIDEEGHIRLRGDEAEMMSIMSKPLVPCSRSLLEAIERLV